HDVVHVVGQVNELQIVGQNRAAFDHDMANPVEQALPVGAAEGHDGEVLNLTGLHQPERLEELVHSAETARKDDEARRVFHKVDFAAEEVVEFEVDIHEPVETLLERQLDVEADGEVFVPAAPGAFARALVGGGHQSRPAAGDDRPA